VRNRVYSIEKRRRKLGYIMLLPATLIILVVSVYPLLYGIYLSFRNQHFLKPTRNDFIGLANYTKLLSDKNFINAIGYTLYYTFGIVVFSYALGMLIALLLNRKIVMRGAMRALVLIPWVIPSTVAATNWRWLLDIQVGFINTMLLALGLIEKPIAFLAAPDYVKNVVVIFGIWKAFPFMTLTLLSGLQGISSDIYEAATIDGANGWQIFRRITLPLLQPVSFVALTLMCIWTFNNFENIYLFTEGGPRRYTTTISIFTYKTAFFSSDISYACASGTSMMFFMSIFGFVYMKLLTANEDATEKNPRRMRG
jgi:multiple sugar transport system permease protein